MRTERSSDEGSDCAYRFFTFVGLIFGALFTEAFPLATLNSWLWTPRRREEPKMQKGVHFVLKEVVVPSDIVRSASCGLPMRTFMSSADRSMMDAKL